MSVEEYRRLRERGKEHLNEGNSLKAIEYYSRSIKIAQRLLEIEPNSYSPLFSPPQVRVTCSNLPDHDTKTCEYCSNYLELAVCYSNRSFAHLNLKEYERALLDSEEAIQLAPEWPKVQNDNVPTVLLILIILSIRDIIGKQRPYWEWNNLKFLNCFMSKSSV